MATQYKILDPVQGLIDYTNDIKPYHSKVIEALIEYVGTDFIDVTVFEDFAFTIEMVYRYGEAGSPPIDPFFVCLQGGYGTPSFGDPENILILSPDVSKTILEYPAIGSGFFIVLNDRTTVFDPDVNIVLIITSSIEDRIISATASVGSPPTGGSFTVFGNKQTEYPVALNFSVVGSTFNNNDYVVASTVVGGSPLVTQILVNQAVPTNDAEGFISVPDSTNTGTFSVINSVFEDDPIIPYTTVYVTGITITPPTLSDEINQRFVSYVNLQPLEYIQILSYSSILKEFATSPPSQDYRVDEGLLIAPIVNLSPTSFSILGDLQSNNLFVGDEFIVNDSPLNDGTYGILSLVYEFDAIVGDFVTKIGVAAVADTTIEGELRIYIPSNVLIIDGGDYTNFFPQGTRVNATSGSHEGSYTALNSKFTNGKTYIRIHETLIYEGNGLPILSTGINYIAVDGDVTSVYNGSPSQQFNIVGSLKNNGSYTSAGATYDGTSNITQILIVEPFDVTDASGEIHVFEKGDISFLPQGFGATLDFCEFVDQQAAISTITDHFEIILGYKYPITGTEASTNKIYIQDNATSDVYNTFINGTTGSPPIYEVKIILSGINNGIYTITNVAALGDLTVLTVAGSPALQDSGSFAAGSPLINSGFLRYREWYQYYITNIDIGSPTNDFIVAGDATDDISDTNLIQHLFTGDIYTVSSPPVFDGVNTTISVAEPIVTTGLIGTGSPQIPIDILAGSPIYDDWIISI